MSPKSRFSFSLTKIAYYKHHWLQVPWFICFHFPPLQRAVSYISDVLRLILSFCFPTFERQSFMSYSLLKSSRSRVSSSSVALQPYLRELLFGLCRHRVEGLFTRGVIGRHYASQCEKLYKSVEYRVRESTLKNL